MVTVTIENVSALAVELLKTQLRTFGATVDDNRVLSVSGEMEFQLEGSTLKVSVIQDRGHFPQMMLVGGIRQMVQEAVELAQA